MIKQTKSIKNEEIKQNTIKYNKIQWENTINQTRLTMRENSILVSVLEDCYCY